MATFLDISLFGYFGAVFIFLFTFALVWGVLNSVKFFKGIPGEKGIYGLIALVVAIVVSITRGTAVFVSTLAPWFAALIIFLFFVFLVVKMFSGDDDELFKGLIKNPGVYWTIIVLSVLVLIAALSASFGQQLLDDGTGGGEGVNIDSRNELDGGSPTNQGERVVVEDNTNDNTNIDDDSYTGQPGATATDDFGGNVLATFTHPKVLGMIMLMLVGFFTILLLARNPDPNM